MKTRRLRNKLRKKTMRKKIRGGGCAGSKLNSECPTINPMINAKENRLDKSKDELEERITETEKTINDYEEKKNKLLNETKDDVASKQKKGPLTNIDKKRIKIKTNMVRQYISMIKRNEEILNGLRTSYLDILDKIQNVTNIKSQQVANILKTPFRKENPAELNALYDELNAM